jgi:hypothetical protein
MERAGFSGVEGIRRHFLEAEERKNNKSYPKATAKSMEITGYPGLECVVMSGQIR